MEEGRNRKTNIYVYIFCNHENQKSKFCFATIELVVNIIHMMNNKYLQHCEQCIFESEILFIVYEC